MIPTTVPINPIPSITGHTKYKSFVNHNTATHNAIAPDIHTACCLLMTPSINTIAASAMNKVIIHVVPPSADPPSNTNRAITPIISLFLFCLSSHNWLVIAKLVKPMCPIITHTI